MATPRITWNIREFRRIRLSDSMENALLKIARKGADAGGEGYVARSSKGTNRSRAVVIAATPEAHYDNARNHTLSGPVIDAMRA